jgi:hypothetical protein
MAKGLTPIELEQRRLKQEGRRKEEAGGDMKAESSETADWQRLVAEEEEDDRDLAMKESFSTTFVEDRDIEEFTATIPSAYARFRMCENPRNPKPLSGFWPALLDYRGKAALKGVEENVGSKDGHKILASILTDGYVYHGVASITYKKTAFIETEEGNIYNVSDYRVPRSHCKIQKGAKLRLDQPRFKVEETDTEVTVSLHELYLALIPKPLVQGKRDLLNVEATQEDTEMEVEEAESEELGLEDMFDSQAEVEEEMFSQGFSQVSLEDGGTDSPVFKRRKRTTEEATKVEYQPSQSVGPNTCPLCKVYVGGQQDKIARHIRLSCPENPDVDALEAARRKKKAEKSKKIKCEIKSELPEDKSETNEADDNRGAEPWSGGDCGCRGTQHSPTDCLRLRGGVAHMRLPRHNPAPHLIPYHDFLAPHLLRPIIPVIQALNRRFTNRQNRWIAGLGPPRLGAQHQNTLWPRVVNSFQIPSMFSEVKFQDLFYFNRQQAFQFRNAHVQPMLQARAAQAQGPRGARSSLPHTLTEDSLTCLFLGKVRLNQADRLVAAQLGIAPRQVQKWVTALQHHIFLTDPFIQRNMNLGLQGNLQALLRQGIEATARDQRTSALYGPLTLPNTQLLVVAIDSRAVKIQQSADAHLQKRTISTKIHNNSMQKMTIATCEGLPMITFPLMCSISPAGTDESNCERLITIHEGGIHGGLLTVMESPLTEPVTLVLLQDQGFRKFGFDHAIRRSFTDYQDELVARTNGGFRYFTPSFPSDQYRDQHLNVAGTYANLPGGSRHRSRTANTSATACVKTRWPIETLFGKEHQLSILGSVTEVPNQYLSSSGIPNFESQSTLAVWLQIGDALLFHHGTPHTHKYATVDTYMDHGIDMRMRIEKENPLSEHSGIQWSRQNIFRRPRANEQVNGQPVNHVHLLDQNQTGMTAVTVQEFSSVPLGSFQTRLVRSYNTHLR